MFQRSFLKWSGGKYAALKQLSKDIPMEGDVLVEPFVGSATFALNTNYKRYILSDLNEDLINLYRSIIKRPIQTLIAAQYYFEGNFNNEDDFYRLRALYNKSQDRSERALLFCYLNRHCYNGLIRYNQSGEFNAPFGRYSKPTIPADNWMIFAKKFKHARLEVAGFSSLKFHAKPGVVVYADPPYLPASETSSFCSYTANGFKKKSHLLLDKCASRWSSKGAKVFISNHNVPLIDACYTNAKTTRIFDVARTISADKNNRKAASECLLIY